jgi:hypothetical protein
MKDPTGFLRPPSASAAAPAIARREDDGSFNGLSTRSVLATYSGEFAKALDVQEFPPMKRIPVTEEEIVAAMERARERMPDATRAEIDIPERKPALSHVNVDGHGHLYVFPYINDFEAAEVPVDVYSRDGDALFSGWIPAVRWSDARGDFVYGREADDQSGEERIIRYRIVEPFE